MLHRWSRLRFKYIGRYRANERKRLLFSLDNLSLSINQEVPSGVKKAIAAEVGLNRNIRFSDVGKNTWRNKEMNRKRAKIRDLMKCLEPSMYGAL